MTWRTINQIGVSVILLWLGGCKGMFGPQGLPPDPLFANRKPIESKAKHVPAAAMPFHEPAPAQNPYAVDLPNFVRAR